MINQTKVLIGDNSIEYGVCCANSLRNIQMYAVTRPKDGKVIFNSIISDSPDVVVMDAVMPNMDAIEVIQKVKAIGVKPPKFIVTSSYDSPFLERQIMQNGADYFLLKPFDINLLISRIQLLINSKDKFSNKIGNIEVIVTDIIHMFGIPAHIKGYRYLREAIILSLENRLLLDSVTKKLYPAVAEKFDASASGVERAMRHAIEILWENGNRTALATHFGNKKPTNSEFIAYITDEISIIHKIPLMEVS